jgi:hypothetical protein
LVSKPKVRKYNEGIYDHGVEKNIMTQEEIKEG